MARNGLSYSEAYNTTLEQFVTYQKAFEIKTVDSMHLMAQNAWMTQAAKATKGKGRNTRPAYRNFNDFFDWENEVQNLFHPTKRIHRLDRMAEVNRLMNEYMKKGGIENGV